MKRPERVILRGETHKGPFMATMLSGRRQYEPTHLPSGSTGDRVCDRQLVQFTAPSGHFTGN